MTRSEDQEFRLAVIELEKVVSHPDPDIRNATLKPALRFIIRTSAFRAKWQINLCVIGLIMKAEVVLISVDKIYETNK